MLLTAVILIVAIALIFDFINGFHDAANSIATVVFTLPGLTCSEGFSKPSTS